jgi:ABC-type uncharacterized transport system substrate-binding protein
LDRPSCADTDWCAADYVVHFFDGAHPGDPSVERPAKSALVINLEAAKGLGRTILSTLVTRASEGIQ